MATKYDAILLYSDDIWNNDREKDFTQAKVIGKGKASESECETFFPCGLYYEKGTTDDTGYQCLSITSEDMDVQVLEMRHVQFLACGMSMPCMNLHSSCTVVL